MKQQQDKPVAWIGLGKLGLPMAARLAAVAQVCEPLPGESPEAFKARDICEVYENPDASTFGLLNGGIMRTVVTTPTMVRHGP